MIKSTQKGFVVDFGIDEKVEVIQLSYKGSKGYVNSIVIDRNGIWYDVILTYIVNQHEGDFKPKAVQFLGGFLKSL